MRILLVEDNLDASQALEQILTLAGHTVACAEGGPAALAMAAQERFDLVMVDHCMPQMSGRDFLQALRLMPGWAIVPVILATGIAQEEAERVVASVPGGVVEVLRKPYEPGLLLARLQEMEQGEPVVEVKAESRAEAEVPEGYPPECVE